MRLVEEDLLAVLRDRLGDPRHGHAHFWERALSRRRLVGAALAGGAALGLGALTPAAAEDEERERKAPVLPNAIRGGTTIGPFGLKHFYFPTVPNPVGATNVIANGTGDPSTIRDFHGSVGVVEFAPTGAVSGDPAGGAFWAADVRFIQGQYVGRDNRHHHGAFAFI